MRIISGPRLCPNAWLVIFVFHPLTSKYQLMEDVLVAAKPKRFAQLIGLVMCILYCGLILVARIFAILHIFLLVLAGFTGFSLGCLIYHTTEDAFHRWRDYRQGKKHRIRACSSCSAIVNDIRGEEEERGDEDIDMEIVVMDADGTIERTCVDGLVTELTITHNNK